MSDLPVLRLFRCRPVRAAFDEILRDEMIPDLLSRPGLVDVHVGRKGPGDDGDRVVVSIWASQRAMLESMGADLESSLFHPEHLRETTDRSVEVHSIASMARFPAEREPTILRLAAGTVRPGELPAYVEEVARGVRADHARGAGPLALFLATEPPAGFLTLSTWASWSDIEAATGADLRRPITTQHASRLASFEAEHLEIVPGIVRPSERSAT